MKKRIKIFLGVLAVASTMILSMPAIASQNEQPFFENGFSSIQPRTDIKEWKYAVINGNIYKRLYNYSTGRWETDWILVATGV